MLADQKSLASDPSQHSHHLQCITSLSQLWNMCQATLKRLGIAASHAAAATPLAMFRIPSSSGGAHQPRRTPPAAPDPPARSAHSPRCMSPAAGAGVFCLWRALHRLAVVVGHGCIAQPAVHSPQWRIRVSQMVGSGALARMRLLAPNGAGF